MNRVDRLMAMLLHLQSRRVVRAEELAAHFEISVRTVYRDLAALGEAGVPIVAEAGVGYSLVKGYQVPPIMFTVEEASALFVGGKLVERMTDASLRRQMDSALVKIRCVLPRDRQDHLDRLERSTAVLSPPSAAAPRLTSETLIPIQQGLAEGRVLALEYRNGKDQTLTRREVEPLGLIFYAENWHLIAHCRLRKDVRDFRTDRIHRIIIQKERFNPHPGFSLKEYLQTTPDREHFELAQILFRPECMARVRREWGCGLVEEQPEPASDRLIVTLMTFSLHWLAGWILSFGAKAEVGGPTTLKQLVAEEARQVAAQYSAPKRSPTRKTPAQTLLT